MNARAVEHVGRRIQELQRSGRESVLFGVLALAASPFSRLFAPELTLPLLVSGFVVTLLGVRSLLRRYELIERFATDPDAQVIPEVREYGDRHTGPHERRRLAVELRSLAAASSAPGYPYRALAACRAEVLELADGLDSQPLPRIAAVEAARLVDDAAASPLYGRAEADLRGALLRLLAAFVADPAAKPQDPSAPGRMVFPKGHGRLGAT